MDSFIHNLLTISVFAFSVALMVGGYLSLAGAKHVVTYRGFFGAIVTAYLIGWFYVLAARSGEAV